MHYSLPMYCIIAVLHIYILKFGTSGASATTMYYGLLDQGLRRLQGGWFSVSAGGPQSLQGQISQSGRPHKPILFLILLFMNSLISGPGASRARFLHLGTLSETQHFLNTSLYKINNFRPGESPLSHLMLPLQSRASLVVLSAGPLCMCTCLRVLLIISCFHYHLVFLLSLD